MSEKKTSCKPVRFAKWDLSKVPPPRAEPCTKDSAFFRKMLLVQTLLVMVSKTQPCNNSYTIFPSWAKPHATSSNLWGAPSSYPNQETRRNGTSRIPFLKLLMSKWWPSTQPWHLQQAEFPAFLQLGPRLFTPWRLQTHPIICGCNKRRTDLLLK